MKEMKISSKDDCGFWSHCRVYGLFTENSCVYHEKVKKGEVELTCPCYKDGVIFKGKRKEDISIDLELVRNSVS
jgi:hypothetical protein